MRTRLAALVLWIACAACLLLLSAGCARQGCPGCTELDPFKLATAEGSVSCPYQVSHLDFSTINDPTLLILSGGASHGAWGAGVITGWGQNSAEPRPLFTVVTGISVGALQATPAFLERDDLLEQFFTTTEDSDVFTWTLPLGTNALQSREPLRQKIEQNVTEAVVLEVADPANANRELFVGTVNLDTSEFCPWNLSTIARKAKAAPDNSWERQCWVNLFQKAIFAASGAPVITPPVRINSNACQPSLPKKSMLHADGGVRARVFIGKVLERAQAAQNIVGPNPPPPPPTAYVIMNGKLVTHPECVENSLLPLALRTFEIMDHEALFGSLHQTMTETQSLGPNPTITVKMSWIPDDYCLRFPSSKFDPVLMTALYRKGQAFSLPPAPQPIPWETMVPTTSTAVWPPGTNACPCCRPMGMCQSICVPGQGCP